MDVVIRASSSRFFFNDTATTEIYTLSLHDALPIYIFRRGWLLTACRRFRDGWCRRWCLRDRRSEEHTSELQSPCKLVCRLLLEKKKPMQRDVLKLNLIYALQNIFSDI